MYRNPAFWLRKAALLVAATLLPLGFLQAEEPRADAADDQEIDGDGRKPALVAIGGKMKEEILQMTEFFDTTLPGTLKKYNMVLSFSPRTTDIRSREFIRFPFTVRYGLKEDWEIYAGLTAFTPNPFNGGRNHRWGPGEGRLGFRHNLKGLRWLGEQITWGIEGRTPVGEPPIEIIDHYTHLIPFINTSRKLPIPSTTMLLNFLYDKSLDTPARHPWPPPHAAHRDTFITNVGFLYKPGEFGASLEYSFRYFADDSQGAHLGHQVRTGPIWDLPLWRTQSWGLPGKWQIDLSGRITTEEGMKLDHGVDVRVRWRTTLREVFNKKSYERKPRAAISP